MDVDITCNIAGAAPQEMPGQGLGQESDSVGEVRRELWSGSLISPATRSRASWWSSAASGNGSLNSAEEEDTPPGSGPWRGSAAQAGEVRVSDAHSGGSSVGLLTPPLRYLPSWHTGMSAPYTTCSCPVHPHAPYLLHWCGKRWQTGSRELDHEPA